MRGSEYGSERAAIVPRRRPTISESAAISPSWPAGPGHLVPHVPRQVARTRAMTGRERDQPEAIIFGRRLMRDRPGVPAPYPNWVFARLG
jgi:hypothetical protein